jgi:hypothetical protein
MRRFRFHIGTLVLLVLVLGVSFAALRESNDAWDSGVFTITVGVLLTSVLGAIHRTERRRAVWLGFAIFGTAYLALSLIPSIESRLITTKALAYLDSKMPGRIPNGVGVAYADYDNDGTVDLFVTNNSQPSTLFVNKGNGTFQDVTASVGSDYSGNQGSSNSRMFVNLSSGLWLVGTTEKFTRIGHSLLALIAGFVGGHLSRRFYDKGSGSASRVGSNSEVSGS